MSKSLKKPEFRTI